MKKVPVLALKKRSDEVLRAFRKLSPGWHTRRDLAEVLNGGIKLGPDEVYALEYLVLTNKVDAERKKIKGPIHERWEYSLKEVQP